MSNQIKIRDMKPEDIKEVHYLGSGEQEFEVVDGEERFWKVGVLEDWVASEDDIALVAGNEKELAGFILVAYHPVTRKATFENAYVKPQYRNLFTAVKMYKEAESRLKEKEADFICGFIETENKASIKFLERCGYNTGKQYHWMNKFL